MTEPVRWLLFLLSAIVVPPLTLGLIRKTKARLQNRIGAPLWQPFFNLARLMAKGETVSQTASWIFRSSASATFAVMLILVALAPWLSFKPSVPGADLFLIVYLLALSRFLTMLASLDTASPFGAFGASREATLSLLVEPPVVLSLVALAVAAQTTDLTRVFSFSSSAPAVQLPLWLLSGTGLFISSLVELSRMPVDDPTTHLELTMVHEAMVLENSGKNLALAEWAHLLKMSILYGLCGQCFLHGINIVCPLSEPVLVPLSVGAVFLLGAVTALIEATAVKLQWRKAPEFIAYGLTMGLLACLVAVAGGGLL